MAKKRNVQVTQVPAAWAKVANYVEAIVLYIRMDLLCANKLNCNWGPLMAKRIREAFPEFETKFDGKQVTVRYAAKYDPFIIVEDRDHDKEFD